MHSRITRAPTLHFAVALLFFCLPALAQNSQPPIPVSQFDPGTLGQPGFQFESGVPQSATLIPRGDGARAGHLWIGNTGKSIRIVGEVDGAAPDWPKDEKSILSKDHVEVWLAGNDDPQMPPLFWAQRFVRLTSADQCKTASFDDGQAEDHVQECLNWFKVQEQSYRPLFKRLFLRQWLLSEGISVESYATPAYAVVAKSYKASEAEVLKPSGLLQFRSRLRAGKPGYMFEIDIPYTALPPLDALQVSDFRFMVDVFSAAPAGKKEGAYSTTSNARAYGNPASFNTLHLDSPLEFRISPCNPKLEGKITAYSPTYPEWFVPTGSSVEYQTATFLIEDFGMPSGDPPDYSPSTYLVHNFWRPLGPSEWVCGPNLTYANGNVTRSFGVDTALYDYEHDNSVSEEGFAARKAADGTVLIKIGPRVWNAASQSQCGACPRTELKIFDVDKNSNLITLLNIEDVIGGSPLSSQDFSLSPDWTKVVEYDQKEGNANWSSTTYCLGSAQYTKCDHNDNDKPPEPPLIRQFLRDN